MQRLGYPDAGQAWGHALAQRPEGELPPQLKDAIVEGERQHAAWVGAREARLRAATGAAEASAAPAERKRIERFRSNILGRTKAFHSSPTHFHFPELAEREFHPRDLFPWIEELEAGTERIASEMHSVMNAERAALVPYIQYDDHLPLDQWQSLNRSPDWTAIHLFRNGVEVADNAQFCPQTLELLSRVPQPRIEGAGPNAMFSLLAPRTRIPSHVGISNARLVCHLPLVVPEGCWFRVGAEVRQWKHGEAFVFDDTIEHEAMNPTDELRVVFIFDLWHPDLTEVEREAVTALLGAEGAPTGL
jgi:aspartyl/asparaginyl beta-hydroxylase (cupin superfamily)